MYAAAGRPSAVGRAAVLVGGAIFVISLVGFVYVYLRHWDVAATGSVWRPALFDIGLFTLFALHHSLFARLGIRGWVQKRVSPRYERSVYVWVSSLLFVAVYLGWHPVPGVLWTLSGLPAAVFTAVQLAAGLLSVQAARRLDVFDLAGLRQGFDLASSRPPGLVTGGLYNLVRHPVYLGWVLFVWPTPVMTGTRLVFAAISTAYLVAAVPLEERTLTQTFGPEYTAYTRRVRWRMIPGVY